MALDFMETILKDEQETVQNNIKRLKMTIKQKYE